MAWGKMDDKFHRNPKVRRLRRMRGGTAALGTWSFWWSWCLDDPQLSGVVPAEELESAEDRRSATLLVEVGLWDEVEGGYLFHDFHQYNPTAAQREAKKAYDREFAAQRRSAKKHHTGDDPDPSRSRVVNDSDTSREEIVSESFPRARTGLGWVGVELTPTVPEQRDDPGGSPEVTAPRPWDALCARWAEDTGVLAIDVSGRDRAAAERICEACARLGLAWLDVYLRWREDAFVQREQPPLTHLLGQLQKYVRDRPKPAAKGPAKAPSYDEFPDNDPDAPLLQRFT